MALGGKFWAVFTDFKGRFTMKILKEEEEKEGVKGKIKGKNKKFATEKNTVIEGRKKGGKIP